MSWPDEEDVIAPCPFCGHEVELHGVASRWWIECQACGCQPFLEGSDADAVIARWNHRPAEAGQLAKLPQWERVPDGTYVTRHGDGIISYGGDQLSISKRQKRMVIFVGTLPEGWELHRRVKTEPTP